MACEKQHVQFLIVGIEKYIFLLLIMLSTTEFRRNVMQNFVSVGYMSDGTYCSPVKMFCSSRQHRKSSRQQMPSPLARWWAPGEVQCGVSGKKLTEGSKIAGCRHILTGLLLRFFIN